MSGGYKLIERGSRPLYFEDLYCPLCENLEREVAFERNEWPECCGKKMRIAVVTPRQTDCYGTPRYSEASGKWHSSRRELVKEMREAGFYESGDPVHGARNTLELKDSSFSYPGKISRRSSDERRRERKKLRHARLTGKVAS
jgi:hypothetical protein